MPTGYYSLNQIAQVINLRLMSTHWEDYEKLTLAQQKIEVFLDQNWLEPNTKSYGNFCAFPIITHGNHNIVAALGYESLPTSFIFHWKGLIVYKKWFKSEIQRWIYVGIFLWWIGYAVEVTFPQSCAFKLSSKLPLTDFLFCIHAIVILVFFHRWIESNFVPLGDKKFFVSLFHLLK